jgi:hypothetical protein
MQRCRQEASREAGFGEKAKRRKDDRADEKKRAAAYSREGDLGAPQAVPAAACADLGRRLQRACATWEGSGSLLLARRRELRTTLAVVESQRFVGRRRTDSPLERWRVVQKRARCFEGADFNRRRRTEAATAIAAACGELHCMLPNV